jgi:hypothetical protein
MVAAQVLAHAVGQLAADSGMALIQLLRSFESLVPGPEQHGVNDSKRGMETADCIVEQVGMLSQRHGDPRVS